MQGDSDRERAKATSQVRDALACATRHIGPCTTFIRLSQETLYTPRHGFIDMIKRPGVLPCSSMLVNVTYFEVDLRGQYGDDRDDIQQLSNWLLQRMPNLLAAQLISSNAFCGVPRIPLVHLKHLRLHVWQLASLEGMRFGESVPALQTARVSACGSKSGLLSKMDVSGCKDLVRLVIDNIVVCHLEKQPKCWLKVDLAEWRRDDLEATQLQSMFSAVDELRLSYRDVYHPQGLVAIAAMPNVKVPKFDDICDGSDCELFSSLESLKSIICGNCDASFDSDSESERDHYIPADLGSVEELMFATRHPLELVFGDGHSAGERLNTLYIIARHVKVDALALLGMNNALLSRGLTLRMVKAEQGHRDFPAQCMYLHAISALVLSYDEARRAVDARLERWGRHSSCAQCGACFTCLREAGVLEAVSP